MPQSPRHPPSPRRRRNPRRRTHAAILGGVIVLLLIIAIATSNDGDSSSVVPVTNPTTTVLTTPTDTTGTTSLQPARPGTSPVSVAAVGDTMMGTPEFGLPPDDGATLFSAVTPLLTGDVVMGNLEGTLASGASSKCAGATTGTCFAFATPPAYANTLKAAGFTMMSLANNHAMDLGSDGMASTVTALSRAGIRATGRPGEITLQDVGSTTVAAVGFAPYDWAQDAQDIPAARALVRRAATQAPVVIAYMHVGAEGVDHRHVPTGAEDFLGEPRGDARALAHALVDAGADLVVGSGPHVLRGMEFRNGRLIAYSMGNFVGYRAFAVTGASGVSGVLQVHLDPDGRFRSGRIAPVMLNGDGVPSPGGSGTTDVATLSSTDFGSSAARVSSDGTIAPPT